MEVGWFDITTGIFHRLAETRAYNWQQGCMLRWVPNSGDRFFTFNDYRNNSFVSVVADSHTGELISERPYPTYDAAPSGELIANCDFTRLHLCRLGYGYWQQTKGGSPEHPRDLSTVMVPLHNQSGHVTLPTIDLREIRDALEIEFTFEQVYVNHLSFSPDSQKLVFLFFWRDADRPRMAVLFYDKSKDSVYALTRNYMSHFTWENPNGLIAWGEDDTRAQAYYRYTLDDKRQFVFWAESGLSDGHCSILPDGAMLTDTYPDEKGIQHLFVRDPGGRVRSIAFAYSPASFHNDLRCDLHPRLTGDPQNFTFDAAHGGRRATYLVRLQPDEPKGKSAVELKSQNH